ncbi:hypothetical protein VTJ04DRAFT_7899 [Mycothermus thermophilus]|uniref:uncharacterized protein n=1 Tax=Humicola insolens TaxID=85995 RepID=UPI0037421DE3
MHLLALLGALTSLATALPTPSTTSSSLNQPTQHQKRTCTAIHPPTSQTPRVYLANRPDISTVVTQTVTWTLPPDALLPASGPCTLRARFPSLWEIVDTSVAKGGAPLPVNVFSETEDQQGLLIGVTTFASPNKEDNAPSPDGPERVVVVNSFACKETMTFRFELAGEGEVGFVNGLDEGLGLTGGLEIVYGC